MATHNQGISSKNVRHVIAPKVEPRSKAIREQATGQIGGSYGDHTTNKGETGWRPGPLYGGKGYNNPVGPTNMALSGPGAGREVMRSGGQGQHGAPAQGNPPPSGNVFAGWPTPKQERLGEQHDRSEI